MNFKKLSTLLLAAPLFLQSCGTGDQETSSVSAAPPGACNKFSVQLDTATESYYCGSFTYYESQRKDVQFKMVGFTPSQVATLKLAIDMVMQRITDHFYQANVLNKKPTDLIACANKYAKTQFQPEGLTTNTITSGGVAAEAMISQLFHTMEYHARVGMPALITAYEAPDFKNTGKASLTNYMYGPERSMDVSMNKISLDYPWRDKTEVFASTLFHEWAHRTGFRHPGGVYDDTAIYEVDECIRRNNKDKTALAGLEPKNPEIDMSDSNKAPLTPGANLCQYKHKKDTKGGRSGQVTSLDAFGAQKSCDKNGDWKKSCKDGNGDTDEVDCGSGTSTPPPSSSGAMCQYKHKKNTQGGQSGQVNAFDAFGKTKSCDKNGDWKKSCKDGNGDTDEVECK